MDIEIYTAPKVFISYSWDSEEHQKRVLDLSERLRNDGIDCNIDQYEMSPTQGWPQWMLEHIEQSDFVLIICTERYYKRATNKEEPEKGKGVAWEVLITQDIIYDSKANHKFIPTFFNDNDQQYVPRFLSGRSRYNISTEAGYEGLFRLLNDDPAVIKNELGPRKKLGTKNNNTNIQQLTQDNNQSQSASLNPSRLTIIKKESLGKRLETLVKQHEAASNQLYGELNAANKILLENQLNGLETEIEKIDAELKIL